MDHKATLFWLPVVLPFLVMLFPLNMAVGRQCDRYPEPETGFAWDRTDRQDMHVRPGFYVTELPDITTTAATVIVTE